MKERKDKVNISNLKDFVLGNKYENSKRYICNSELFNMIADFTFEKTTLVVIILWGAVFIIGALTTDKIGLDIWYYAGGVVGILSGMMLGSLSIIKFKSNLNERVDLNKEVQKIRGSATRLYVYRGLNRTICFREENGSYIINKLESTPVPVGKYVIKFNKRGNAFVKEL